MLVYLGLGSNLGDRMTNIVSALIFLKNQLQLLNVSSLYESDPWGHQKQPNFFNCVCVIDCVMNPYDLLKEIKQIEHNIGRKKNVYKWGPRVIDIDILLYDKQILKSPSLTIPHKHMLKRSFVINPLVELVSDLVHPVTKIEIKDLVFSEDLLKCILSRELLWRKIHDN